MTDKNFLRPKRFAAEITRQRILDALDRCSETSSDEIPPPKPKRAGRPVSPPSASPRVNRRRLANRQSAARSRQRKCDQLKHLQNVRDQLVRENAALSLMQAQLHAQVQPLEVAAKKHVEPAKSMLDATFCLAKQESKLPDLSLEQDDWWNDPSALP